MSNLAQCALGLLDLLALFPKAQRLLKQVSYYGHKIYSEFTNCTGGIVKP